MVSFSKSSKGYIFMFSPKLQYILAALFILAIANVTTATDTPKTGMTTLDTIVVTAQKTPDTFETGDVDLTRTPSFYTVIKREAYEGRMTNLSQVLEKEAGIQVRQFGGFGSFSSVSLRGSTSEQVMIYLDGVLLNDASGGGVDLSTISLEDVAAVEIYKGSVPIQFGKASIGGVINIKTLRAQDGLNGNVSGGYGSFDTMRSSALVNYKRNQWDVLFSGEFLKSENDFKFLNAKGTLWTTDDDQWERRENAQMEQVNVLGKAGFNLSNKTRISLVNQWFKKDQGIAAWNNNPDNEASLATRRNISTLRLTADDVSSLHLNTAVSLDTTWQEETYKDKKGHIGLGRQHTRNTTYKYGLNSYAEWMTNINILTVTGDIRYEHYTPSDLGGQTVTRDSNRTLLNLGMENTLLLMNHRLAVTPAIRFTYIKNRLKSETTAAGASLEELRDTQQHWSPQLGVKYQVLDWLVLKTNLNRYVREPSFFELFGDRGFFVGNMGLKPEKGTNWDIGAEAEWFFTQSPVERLTLNLVYFYSDVDDLITRAYDARGIGRSVNISGSRIQGIEAGMTLNFFEYFSFSGNMTLQDTRNKSSIAAFDGKKLPGRYGQSYMGRLEAGRWNAKVYLEYLVDKNLYYDTTNLLKAPDKEELNFGTSYLFRDHWRFNADVKNIQDNYFEDFYRYPMPGRSVSASVTYIF